MRRIDTLSAVLALVVIVGGTAGVAAGAAGAAGTATAAGVADDAAAASPGGVAASPSVADATVEQVSGATDGRLTGTVRSADNDPIANATIRVVGPNRTVTFENATDATGDYNVGVAAGNGTTYTVEVIRPGFASLSRSVEVAAGETERVDVTLLARATVEALCVKPETEVALVGDTVAVDVIAFAGVARDSARVEGVTVELATTNPAVRVVGPTVRTTGADGVATFEVTADEVASAEFEATIVGRGVGVTNGSVAVRDGASTTFPNGVPGVDGSAPPTDPDGDGTYEDVNGDGTADFTDAVALLFADRAAIDADPAMRAALDVDGSGTVDFLDVVALVFD